LSNNSKKSRKRTIVLLKPLIRKIEITDRENPEVIYIKIEGLQDSDTVLMASGILGLMQLKGFKPKVEIDYSGTILKLGFPNE